MSNPVQRSFAGGEIAPALYARVDTVKYATGLRTCRNALILRHGGAANRPGTTYVGATPAGAEVVRLIPFVFNSDQTYALEFSENRIRVIRDGAYVTSSTLNASDMTYGTVVAFTDATYGVITGFEHYLSLTMTSSSGFSVGDFVYLQATKLFGGVVSRLKVYAVPDSTHLRLVNDTGVGFIYDPSVTSFLGHPWPGNIVKEQAYATLTLVSTTSFGAGDTAFIANTDGTNSVEYSVSAVPTGTTIRVTNLNGSAPIPTTITASAAPKHVTKNFRINSTYLASELFDIQYVQSGDVLTLVHPSHPPAELARLAHDNWTLTDINFEPSIAAPSGFARSGGSAGTATYWQLTAVKADSYEESYPTASVGASAAPTSGAPQSFTWTASADAVEYNLYRSTVSGGPFGFIGTTSGTTFTDNGLTPDLLNTPPRVRENFFDSSGNYPSTVSYLQQRLVFANTNDDPEKIWTSQSGNYHNFSISSPLQDDDAITFTLAGRQVNAVKHILDLGTAVTFTSGGEWILQGDGAGILKPTAINAKQQSYNGSSRLLPLIIGGNALYVQARGQVVRDLAFDYQVDGYRGNDLTIFSSHLVDGFTLIDWTYQQIPQSIAWAVRSDGVLLGLTYVREQQIFAWHRHDFKDGLVESVCAVPEGIEDSLYLVINRNGVRSVERMNSRFVDDIKDCIFMDAALTYDGRNTDTTFTMTVSTYLSGAYTSNDTVQITASASYFEAGDVGNEVHLTDSNGTLVRFSITAFTSSTVVRATPNKNVPVAMQASARSTWALAVDQLSGLNHIEGYSVSVLADGFVVANPNVDTYDVIAVDNGSVTLPRCYSVIHVGLPITCDLETLDIDSPQGETMVAKKKLITRVSVFLEKSRGLWVGPAAPDPDGTDILDGLEELKIRNEEGYDEPIALKTGAVSINIRPEWNSNGRIFIRQTDPLPMTVLAIAPSGLFPYKPGGL